MRTNVLRERLQALGRNMWWSWQPEADALFRDLDPARWEQLRHNPIALLSELSDAQLMKAAAEQGLPARVEETWGRLRSYLSSESTWGAKHGGVLGAGPVAYFSAEFGVHESLPIYSGGLGVLAGDHLKSASDLGIPLVALGLLYHRGYFTQRLDASGWQNEDYPEIERSKLPIRPALDPSGKPLTISVQTRKDTIFARVWQVSVGRTTLLLLDSDVEENRPEDRQLTAQLYGGDDRTRIRQELLLGVGGARVLNVLGIRPGVIHLNEGHSAFAALEFVRQRMDREAIGFAEACERVATNVVFTTHTPVPAGHDRFSDAIVDEHLGPLADAMWLDLKALLALGRVTPDDPSERFCMTVLALKLSRHANGVSSLHGGVSRRMWRALWPSRLENEIPIGHITNGVHATTWIATSVQRLYDRRLAPEWREREHEPELWERADRIEDLELWEVRQALKAQLIGFAQRQTSTEAERRGESPEVVDALRSALRTDALLIGFARRFATYKRAALVLEDYDWLLSLVENADRPVQFVFAGKSHPRDEGGKSLIQAVHKASRDPRLLGKVVFLENYDIGVARYLVQGVDVWLNNPRRPLEASGTSGEKVVLNGGLHCSILDGWWAEAYDGANGFAIGGGETHRDSDVQDERDATELKRTLLEQVVPLYYDRDSEGLPRRWLARIKRSIRTLGWRFNADRMLIDYVTECYLPAAGGVQRNMSARR